MPEYGIDAIFALYESKCILVGVALRPPPVADKGSKALSEITSKRQYTFMYNALRLYFRREDIIRPTTRTGNGDIPYE